MTRSALSSSRFRRVGRWVPPATLGIALCAAWAALFSGGMRGVVAWLLLLSALPLLGLIVLPATAVYAALKRRLSRPIILTLLLSAIALWPGAWNFGMFQIAYPASLASMRPSASVRLPSDQPVRAAWGGDRLATNRHAFTPDQRWAYDLVIDPAFTGAARLEDYGCWGTTVVAPVTGRVHLTNDGEIDAVPGLLSANFNAPLGNHVVFELDTGTFLLIAHLQRGSVAVKPGDRVPEGQPIGRCGNSGNTSEPHIHIHHQRQDPAQFPVNFAEGLPLYFRDHDGAPMPEGGLSGENGSIVLHAQAMRHIGSSGR